MQMIVDRCSELAARGAPTAVALAAVLREADFSGVDLPLKVDLSRPYGRRVFLNTDAVEGMLATWTPLTWCAPHDHGGSVGGVRVVRGAARHRVFRVRAGSLELVREERIEAGGVISCGPDLVHAMRDDGEEESLVTLHLYSGPIPWMVVYDTEGDATWQVEGGCGAWIPHDQPELVRQRRDGIVPVAEMVGGLA